MASERRDFDTTRNDPDRNPDPITGAPGAHPIGTGVGAAGGGAAGAAIGAAVSGPAFPVGAAIGAVVGAIAGGLAGKGAAEAVNPTSEDEYWREAHRSRPYYEPSFSYRWDLVERWLPEQVAEGRRLSRAAAADRLLLSYLRGAVFARRGSLGRLFALSADEVAASLARLARAGAIEPDAEVAGWPGQWVVAR